MCALLSYFVVAEQGYVIDDFLLPVDYKLKPTLRKSKLALRYYY